MNQIKNNLKRIGWNDELISHFLGKDYSKKNINNSVRVVHYFDSHELPWPSSSKSSSRLEAILSPKNRKNIK